jgi:hypothetical protein
LNGTHQLLAYTYDVNIMGENTDTMKKNIEALLDASKEVGLEVNPENTKYMHSGEFHDLYTSPDIITQVKSRRMWHAWESEETCTGFWWESPKEKGHLKDQGIDGRMGSKWTLG